MVAVACAAVPVAVPVPADAPELPVEAAAAELYGDAVTVNVSLAPVQVMSEPVGSVVRGPPVVLSELVPVHEGKLAGGRKVPLGTARKENCDTHALASKLPVHCPSIWLSAD